MQGLGGFTPLAGNQTGKQYVELSLWETPVPVAEKVSAGTRSHASTVLHCRATKASPTLQSSGRTQGHDLQQRRASEISRGNELLSIDPCRTNFSFLQF